MKVKHHRGVYSTLQSHVPSRNRLRNKDKGNREKQHNYVKDLPNSKGANPPSRETTGAQSQLVTNQY
eukprot:8023413-Heterocapsa_arctica.AAC.1